MSVTERPPSIPPSCLPVSIGAGRGEWWVKQLGGGGGGRRIDTSRNRPLGADISLPLL